MWMRFITVCCSIALCIRPVPASAEDCPEPVGRWPYGVSNSVAAEGDLALLANGAALQVVDLTDPSAPAVLGELHLVHQIDAVAVSGDRGYALTSDNLHVVDLSAPATPSEMGVLGGFSTTVSELAAVGDRVYVLGWGVLFVVDAGTPSAPVLSGELVVSGLDIEAAADHVFLAAGGYGLRVVDVSDPTAPAEVASVDLGADTSARYLDVVNGRAYVSGGGTFPDAKLFVVDVTDPEHPVLEADAVIADGGGDIVARDGFAHIFGGYPDALHIYDLTIPQTPVWLGSATIPSEYWERLAAVDDHILVTTYLRGLTVVETTDPTAPAPVSTLDAPGRIWDAAYSNGVLFIAAEDRGLRMVDVHDPSHPVELGYSQVVPQVAGVAVRGEIAYVPGYSSQGLVAVDVSDPAAPVILGNAPGAVGEWVTLAGDRAYVVNPHFGVYVVDVSTPALPVLVGTLDLPSGTGEQWEWPVVSGDHVFVRNNHSDPSVAIIDVGDPAAPTQVGSLDVTANVAGLAVTGSWLLVPDIGSGPEVRIFDVSNPVAPVERDPYLPVNGYVEVVAVSGSVAYMSLWTGSYPDYAFAVEVVNFADPGAPEFMGLSHDTGLVRRLPTGPGEVFAITLETGFDIFALCHDPIFADGFESGDASAWAGAVP